MHDGGDYVGVWGRGRKPASIPLIDIEQPHMLFAQEFTRACEALRAAS